MTYYLSTISGDEVPVIHGSALLALQGQPEWKQNQQLMAAVDEYIQLQLVKLIYHS